MPPDWMSLLSGYILLRGRKQPSRPFTPEEDALLSQVMKVAACSSWIDIAERIPGRTARQCRDRWENYVCPRNKNGPWTPEEDIILVQKVREHGCRWAKIAKSFDGRSENNVKNRWYTCVRSKSDIDPLAEPVAPHEAFPLIISLPPTLIGPSVAGAETSQREMDSSSLFPEFTFT
jgi:hypothetical protein